MWCTYSHNKHIKKWTILCERNGSTIYIYCREYATFCIQFRELILIYEAKYSSHAKNNKPSHILYQKGPSATSYQVNQNENPFNRPKKDSDKEYDSDSNNSAFYNSLRGGIPLQDVSDSDSVVLLLM